MILYKFRTACFAITFVAASIQAQTLQTLATVETDRIMNVAQISGAGDFNADGYADVLVVNATGAAIVYGGVSFGPIDASDLAADQGVSIVPPMAHPTFHSIAPAGDVNGDGFDDVILGQPDDEEGRAIVVFGKSDNNLVDLNTAGSHSFSIFGGALGDRLGVSVSGAGDVNADGFADVIVGADGVEVNGVDEAGSAYVIFGSQQPATVEVDALQNGFWIAGDFPFGNLGTAVAGAGDTNGDGYDDVVVGSTNFNISRFLKTFDIVFGQEDNLSITQPLGSRGFRAQDCGRGNDYDRLGVAGVGDINGDGLADVVAGDSIGIANVLYGGVSDVVLGLCSLDDNGFSVSSPEAVTFFGSEVSGVGDWNGGGFSSFSVGAPFAIGETGTGMLAEVGNAYLMGFGNRVENPLLALRGQNAEDKLGLNSVGVGDVNGDGRPDVAVTAAGDAYVVTGHPSAPAQALYSSVIRAGNAPMRAVGTVGNGALAATPDARVWIDYEDGDNVSMETVVLHRSPLRVPGITTTGSFWDLASDRQRNLRVKHYFRYTEADVSGMIQEDLKVYRADTVAGPFELVVSVPDVDRNRIVSVNDELGVFVIGHEDAIFRSRFEQ